MFVLVGDAKAVKSMVLVGKAVLLGVRVAERVRVFDAVGEGPGLLVEDGVWLGAAVQLVVGVGVFVTVPVAVGVRVRVRVRLIVGVRVIVGECVEVRLCVVEGMAEAVCVEEDVAEIVPIEKRTGVFSIGRKGVRERDGVNETRRAMVVAGTRVKVGAECRSSAHSGGRKQAVVRSRIKKIRGMV